MRLIDVDALPDDAGWCGDALIEAINNAPTVSAERTGKWVRLYRNGFGNLIGHCEKCGRKYPVDNFCPNCGARMVT